MRHEGKGNDHPATRKMEITLEYSKEQNLTMKGNVCKYWKENWSSLIIQKSSTVLYYALGKKLSGICYNFSRFFESKGLFGYMGIWMNVHISTHCGRNTSVHSSQLQRRHQPLGQMVREEQFKSIHQTQKSSTWAMISIYMFKYSPATRFWYTGCKKVVVWPVSVPSIDCAVDNDLQCPAGAALKSKLRL